MNFSSHCSQICCLALQFLPSLLMFTLNSHFIFTFTFWVPCWSGWINIKSFSFPSDQLIKFSHLEDVGCLEYFYQMQTKLTFKLDFPVAGSFRNYCDVSIVHWWTGGIEIKGIAGVVSNLICIWDAIQQFFFTIKTVSFLFLSSDSFEFFLLFIHPWYKNWGFRGILKLSCQGSVKLSAGFSNTVCRTS